LSDDFWASSQNKLGMEPNPVTFTRVS